MVSQRSAQRLRGSTLQIPGFAFRSRVNVVGRDQPNSQSISAASRAHSPHSRRARSRGESKGRANTSHTPTPNVNPNRHASKVVRHSEYLTFQTAEVAVPRALFCVTFAWRYDMIGHVTAGAIEQDTLQAIS